MAQNVNPKQIIWQTNSKLRRRTGIKQFEIDIDNGGKHRPRLCKEQWN